MGILRNGNAYSNKDRCKSSLPFGKGELNLIENIAKYTKQ
jgi:hypothetical protein